MAAVMGKNFWADKRAVQFFGLTGRLMKNGDWDAYVNLDGCLQAVEGIDPDPVVTPGFQACLNGDIENGLQEQVKIVLLSPQYGLFGYLEGLYTKKHLRWATEGFTRNMGIAYVDIPRVQMAEGYELTVRVLAEFKLDIATADAAGSVL